MSSPIAHVSDKIWLLKICGSQMKHYSSFIYFSQWFLLLRKKRNRLHIKSTVITASITMVGHEAKNHCNFSIADTSRPISYISQKMKK